jgi:hypothetical protein
MNILYYGIKGVNERDEDDLTCTELILLIGKNCHSITMTKSLIERYREHLDWLRQKPAPVLQSLSVLNQLVVNSQKAVWEQSEPPEIPVGINIPQKDRYLVRAALISQPLVVTCDNSLRHAINDYPQLNLRALHPTDALPLAKDT